MTLLEKALIKALAKTIVWILRNVATPQQFEPFYKTLPTIVLQYICATRYLGQIGGAYQTINEAFKDTSDPSIFTNQDLVDKVIHIQLATLDQQLDNGIKKL